ncbi:MAG: radical SAM protein, partial [Bacillota bacterium]|nr:radical SAM protein [Bacillota bacterium]
NGERWERILDEIIRRGLEITLLMETRVGDILRDAAILPKYRRAGVMHIYVGVEATNQEALDRFKKDVRCQDCVEAIRLINEHGMVTECSFVLGMPDDTPETIARTLELARHYNPDMPHFLHIAPWPYSDLYQELKDYLITRDYSKYNFVEPVVAPRAMSAEEISAAVIDCYRRYYLAKARDYLAEKDEYKRQYLLRSAQVMMSNSFLAKHLGLGQMPAEIRALFPPPKEKREKAVGG